MSSSPVNTGHLHVSLEQQLPCILTNVFTMRYSYLQSPHGAPRLPEILNAAPKNHQTVMTAQTHMLPNNSGITTVMPFLSTSCNRLGETCSAHLGEEQPHTPDRPRKRAVRRNSLENGTVKDHDGNSNQKGCTCTVKKNTASTFRLLVVVPT